MPVISILGSSHASERHLLPATFTKLYEGMDLSFRRKYSIQTARGIPGGRIANKAVCNDLVSVAQVTAEQPGFGGQVLVLLAGTNDWANPAVTEEEFTLNYKNLVDKLLSIDQTAVIITGLVPRLPTASSPGKRFDMRAPTKLVRMLAQAYQKNGQKVRFLPIDHIVLEPGPAVDGARAVIDGQLKDGIHLSANAVEAIAADLLRCISRMPNAWFN